MFVSVPLQTNLGNAKRFEPRFSVLVPVPSLSVTVMSRWAVSLEAGDPGRACGRRGLALISVVREPESGVDLFQGMFASISIFVTILSTVLIQSVC